MRAHLSSFPPSATVSSHAKLLPSPNPYLMPFSASFKDDGVVLHGQYGALFTANLFVSTLFPCILTFIVALTAAWLGYSRWFVLALLLVALAFGTGWTAGWQKKNDEVKKASDREEGAELGTVDGDGDKDGKGGEGSRVVY